MAKRIIGNDEARFWAKVDRNGPIPEHRPELGPCWQWTAAKTSRGYGNFWLAGRYLGAHRVAYEMLVGPIGDALEGDHLCRNRGCVKVVADERGPAHVEPVTHRENDIRGVGVAGINSVKTHCPAGHKYTPQNTYRRPTGRSAGGRDCKRCRADAEARRRSRLRAQAAG